MTTAASPSLHAPAPTHASFPSPAGTWPIGNVSEFLADKLGFITRSRQRYGDFVALNNLNMRFWLISDPGVIGEVLGEKGASFQKGRGLQRTKVLLGEGLLTSEGAAHDRRSRLARPAFRPEAVARYAEPMVALIAEAAERWVVRSTIDVPDAMGALTLAIAGRTLFGADLRDLAPEIGHALTEALDCLAKRFNALVAIPTWIPTPGNRRFLKAKKVLDDAVTAMIETRRASGEVGDDLLGSLLSARLGGGEAGLNAQELRDEALTLILAGHETTANALAFTWWLLAQHPEAHEQLREEVDRVLGDRPATTADMPALRYTMQVLQESMRIYPPAWGIARQAIEDVELGDGKLLVRRGEMVGTCPFVVHRDERWWPEPLAFKPERFAKEAPRPRPYTYFPFGGGKRGCIGRSFALLEGVMALATLSQRIDFEIDTNREIELEPLMTLRIKGRLPAAIRRRG